jgi:phosphate acetyltransferase
MNLEASARRDSDADLRTPGDTPDAFTVGEETSLVVEITPQAVAAFTQLSGDDAPLHTDAAYAMARGFPGPIVHGALLSAYISRVVGTMLPGPRGLLQQMDVTWHAPCVAPCTVKITATVKHLSVAVRSIRMSVRVEEESGRLLATGQTSHSLLPD